MARSSAAGQGGRLSGIRIIVVEDRPDHLELTMRVLADAGATVRGFRSGQEAFDEVHADAPDVLVVDLGLPDVAGTTVVTRIRRMPTRTHPAMLASSRTG